MKKLIILILFLPLVLQGQEFRIKKNKANINQDIIKFYIANINNIESVNGDSVIFIPFEKQFLPDIKVRDIDGFLAAYEITNLGITKKITLFPAKNSGYEFDFKNSKYKLKKYDNDDNDFFKPKDLKEKLEKAEKIKPDKPKVKP